eukprot:c37635_g1_i1 orf=82-249(+)
MATLCNICKRDVHRDGQAGLYGCPAMKVATLLRNYRFVAEMPKWYLYNGREQHYR